MRPPFWTEERRERSDWRDEGRKGTRPQDPPRGAWQIAGSCCFLPGVLELLAGHAPALAVGAGLRAQLRVDDLVDREVDQRQCGAEERDRQSRRNEPPPCAEPQRQSVL